MLVVHSDSDVFLAESFTAIVKGPHYDAYYLGGATDMPGYGKENDGMARQMEKSIRLGGRSSSIFVSFC